MRKNSLAFLDREREPQYKLENDYILCWGGSDGYYPVAKVINPHMCDVIIKTLKFAEDCEEALSLEVGIEPMMKSLKNLLKNSTVDGTGLGDTQ